MLISIFGTPGIQLCPPRTRGSPATTFENGPTGWVRTNDLTLIKRLLCQAELQREVADGGGLEPPQVLPWLRFSRPAHYRSATHPNCSSAQRLCYHTGSTAFIADDGGGDRIRTCGGVTHSCFRNRCYSPLCHSSKRRQIRDGEDVLGALPLSYVLHLGTRRSRTSSPSFPEITLIQSTWQI